MRTISQLLFLTFAVYSLLDVYTDRDTRTSSAAATGGFGAYVQNLVADPGAMAGGHVPAVTRVVLGEAVPRPLNARIAL